MSFKKTLIIAVIFIAAAGYYVLDQKRIKKNEERKTADSRLVLPEDGAVSEIVIQSFEEAEEKTLKLEKQDDQWMITSPIQTRAASTAMTSFLGALDRAQKSDPFDVEADKLGDFGLAEPAIQVEIKAAAENYVVALEMGDETPDGSNYYARVADAEQVFTFPLSIYNQLTKTPDDLRDKRTLPANLTQATTITLNSEGQTIRAELRDGDWQLLEPKVGKGDNTEFSTLLSDWNNVKGSDFIDTDTLKLAPYGLDYPIWKGTVTVAPDGEEEALELTFLVGDFVEGNPGKRYAMQEGSNHAFALATVDYNKLKPKVSDLRSKEIFTVSSSDVVRATFKMGEGVVPLERDAANLWRFADGDPTRVDQSAVTRKVSDLTFLKIKEFFDEPPEAELTGLDAPILEVTLINRDATTTETLITGKKADDEDYVYARLPGGDEVVGLDWKDPGKFFLTREEIADKSLFDFEPNAVKTLRIIDQDKTLTLDRTETGGWTGKAKLGEEESDKTYQVEGAQVTSMLYTVTGLEWDRPLDPSLDNDATLVQTMKLEAPERELVFIDEDGVELARLGQGGETDRNVYVRRGENEYFAIDKLRYGGIKTAIGSILEVLEPEEDGE